MLGFTAHPGTLEDYLALIARSIRESASSTVFYHNLHSLYSYYSDASLRAHYSGKTVLVDGMPIIWLMQLFGLRSLSREHRLTYVDFIFPMMELARDNDWQVFHVGQNAEVQARAMNIIREKVPGIRIAGHDGYFDQSTDSAESLAVIDEMNRLDTKLLLVGFGTPRQEAWVAAHRHRITAPAVFTCGACMEYVAGEVRTPPRWMGRLGLEWSFRLLENPRRFAFRYLVEPVLLGFHFLGNGLKRGFRARVEHPAIPPADHGENDSNRPNSPA